MKGFAVLTIHLFLTFCSWSANSFELPESYIESNSWVLGAAFGYGKLENPLVDRDDIPLYVLPDIRYYGERLTIDNLDFSYALAEKKGLVIELLGSQNIDGVYFPGEHRKGYGAIVGAHPARPIDLLEPEPSKKPLSPSHRSMSYLMGLELRHYAWLDTYFSWQTDVSKVHHGNEANLKFIKHFPLEKFNITLEGNATYKSAKLVNYYYGVGIQDIINSLKFYSASSTINYHIGITAAYPISENLAIIASLKQQWLGDEIVKSPVVHDESPQSYFLGVKYVL